MIGFLSPSLSLYSLLSFASSLFPPLFVCCSLWRIGFPRPFFFLLNIILSIRKVEDGCLFVASIDYLCIFRIQVAH